MNPHQDHQEKFPIFYEIQTSTGWAWMLNLFAQWCNPTPGWKILDAGSGPGYLAACFENLGCHSTVGDINIENFLPRRPHSHTAVLDMTHLPFSPRSFDLIAASNVLFLLPQPTLVLQKFVRCLKSSGAIALINPSELMSIASTLHLSDERRLNGINRSSLINYAQLAESHSRWSEADLKNLFARSGLNLVKSELQMGSGLVRFALAEISPAA